jgi:putative Mn2+ efflux pump MntP
MSHLVIGDILVEHINVLYPIGDYTIDSTIRSSSLQHISLEAILIGFMAAVVITKFKHRKEESFLTYHGAADSILYLLLVLAISVSFMYILNEFRFSLERVLILVILHSSAIATIILLWIGSRGSKPQQHIVPN